MRGESNEVTQSDVYAAAQAVVQGEMTPEDYAEIVVDRAEQLVETEAIVISIPSRNETFLAVRRMAGHLIGRS